MNSHICAKSESLPCNCCVCFRLQVLFRRNSFKMFVVFANFSFGKDHVSVSELNFIPKTVPEVEGPNDFSLFGQGGAKGMFSFLHMYVYVSEKVTVMELFWGETIGMSSSWRCIHFLGMFFSVQIMFTIVSGI